MNKEFKSAISYIISGDKDGITRLLLNQPHFINMGFSDDIFVDDGIIHQFYVGDSLLHLASAGHDAAVVTILLNFKFDPNSRANKRKAAPLHYASDGIMGRVDENAQVKTIEALLKKGADVNVQDANGATPLHRAVRCRCFSAVKLLVKNGSLTNIKNRSGSTPLKLASVNSGRGGSGSDLAKENQRHILNFLQDYKT